MRDNDLKLKFRNPIFDEINLKLTIRLGVKWLDKEGRGAYVTDSHGKIEYGYASIIKTELVRFCDIKAKDLEFQHDPDCRSYNGIWNTMKLIYPDMTERSWVTLVFFYFESVKPKG
jgi:hypothetical protein